MALYIAYGLVTLSWMITLIVILRKKSDKEGFLSKVFTSNEDLDTTLSILLRGAVVFAVLAIVVIYFSMFHDDLDKSDVGMLGMHVVGMATNALTLVAVVNGQKDKGHGEKKTEKSKDG